MSRPAGSYVRRIILGAPDTATVVAALEDDFHRFALTLHHDGARVTGCTGEAIRYPWSECPGALTVLSELKDVPLARRGTSISAHVDSHANCTHLFDLAGLAVAHAAAGRTRREYLAVVPDRDPEGRTHARLSCDGTEMLAWEVAGLQVQSPSPYSGVQLRGGFLKWAAEHLADEEAEWATVLRRACEISWGRQAPLDGLERAVEVGDFMIGVCHTFTAGRAEVALRIKGSVRDFSGRPEALLA